MVTTLANYIKSRKDENLLIKEKEDLLKLLKEYKALTKTNYSKVKAIAFGKATKEDIKNTKYNIEQIVEKINHILK